MARSHSGYVQLQEPQTHPSAFNHVTLPPSTQEWLLGWNQPLLLPCIIYSSKGSPTAELYTGF